MVGRMLFAVTAQSIAAVAAATVVGLLVAGVVLAVVIKAVIVKLVTVALAVVFALVVWSQREELQDCAATVRERPPAAVAGDQVEEVCQFFGIDVDVGLPGTG
jgi:hypothetical protein